MFKIDEIKTWWLSKHRHGLSQFIILKAKKTGVSPEDYTVNQFHCDCLDYFDICNSNFLGYLAEEDDSEELEFFLKELATATADMIMSNYVEGQPINPYVRNSYDEIMNCLDDE